MMSALTCSGFQSGCCEWTSAAVPATIGVAIDVPLSLRPWLPVPLPAEKTLTPTAVTSGLTLPASLMPREEKPATGVVGRGVELREPVRVVPLMVTVSPASSSVRMASPPDFATRTPGCRRCR